MAARIKFSVGKKGKNAPEDVKAVQALLNPFATELGFAKLKVDGENSARLERAISLFQEQVCKFRPDGRVDPGKRTLKTMNAGLSKYKSSKKSELKQADKVKEAAREKLLKSTRAAVEKRAKDTSVSAKDLSALWSDMEKKANALYDSYFAKSEKKGEPVQQAADKIAAQVEKETHKVIASEIKVLDTGKLLKPGRLSGKTAGVNPRIIKVLMEVSSFYGETLHVVSGLRNKRGQASAMFGGWNSHLRQGRIYPYLRNNESLRLELHGFVEKSDKAGFTNCMLKKADWKQVSRHLTGDAVDITTRTDAKIIKALETVLRYLPERNSEGIKCHHFDNRKLVYPISDAIKSKWQE